MIQSTFAELWENRAVLHIPGEFESYIFTVVRNKISSHYRRLKVSQRYLDTFQQYLVETEDTTDHRARHHNLANLIEIEIDALPSALKEVFLLSRNTAMSRKDIAVHLDLTEEGVKTRMHQL